MGISALLRRRVGRTILATLAVSTVIATLPYLQTAKADAAPTFTQTNLVSDVPGMAKTTNSNLVNPWGMALGLNSGIWISANGSGKELTFDGTGQSIPAGSPL